MCSARENTCAAPTRWPTRRGACCTPTAITATIGTRSASLGHDGEKVVLGDPASSRPLLAGPMPRSPQTIACGKPHPAKSRARTCNFRGIVTFSDSISPDTLRLNPNTSFVEATWYWHGLLGTSVAEKASFFSRFFYKILEIMGAAVATAVSGYLVAHLGGFLPSQNQAPTPPEVVAVPSERPAPKSVPGNPPASQTATVPQPTQSAGPDGFGEPNGCPQDGESPTAGAQDRQAGNGDN
jgi:hypothetical protein